MIDITDALPLSPTSSVTLPHKKDISRLWSRIALAAVLLLSIFMNFFQLGQNGYGNLYYAATVRSMADNWRNFFFASFDPGGFVTVDKPPLGFWLQTLSAKIFGFTPFSIFLPQALCGVLAVLLLYSLVRRHFGVAAGLVASLALAVSPITVVTSRNNTIDGTLALVLLLAAWAVIYACETGKLRWLLLSGVFVGLGFNIKMAEAYLVVPALGMAYLLCAPCKIWMRLWHLLLSLLIMLAISLCWLVAVDLTPASQRPYVGSTKNNSAISLAFGYNGLNRLKIGENGYGRNRPDTGTSGTGQDGGSAFTDNAGGATNLQSLKLQGSNNGNAGGFGNASNLPRQFQGGRGALGSGTPSPFRLFSVSLGGQIGWLLPFALLAIVALACQLQYPPTDRWNEKNRTSLPMPPDVGNSNGTMPNMSSGFALGLVLWGFWLLTMAIFFSVDGSFHQYYMTEMAPGLSALVGIGLVVMWQQYWSSGWRGWLLPIALVVTAAAQIYMLASYPSWSRWLSPLIGILTVPVVITLIFLRLRPQLNVSKSVFRGVSVLVSAGLLALFVSPTVWAGYSVIYNTESSFPIAGPTAQSNLDDLSGGSENEARVARGQIGFGGSMGGFGGFAGGSAQTDPALISYLETHQGHAKFLVATPNANTADSIILSTNKAVMALGGFSGNDPILTTNDLQTLIKNGTVRFFLINSQRGAQRLMDQHPKQHRKISSGRGRTSFNFGGADLGGGGFEDLGQNSLSTWVSSHCSSVPTSNWQSSTSNFRTGQGNSQLYDCASARS